MYFESNFSFSKQAVLQAEESFHDSSAENMPSWVVTIFLLSLRSPISVFNDVEIIKGGDPIITWQYIIRKTKQFYSGTPLGTKVLLIVNRTF